MYGISHVAVEWRTLVPDEKTVIAWRESRRALEWAAAAFFLLLGLVGLARVLAGQDRIETNQGLGWDGVDYQKLFEFFLRGDVVDGPPGFPFCLRVGTPWLVSHLNEFGLDFYAVNLGASVLFVLAIYILTAKYSLTSVKAAVGIAYLSSFLFFAPVRFVTFYPVYTDPVFLLLLTLIAILLHAGWYRAAMVLCIATIPFREAALYVIPFIMLVLSLLSEQRRRDLLWGVVLAALGYALAAFLPAITGCEPQSQIRTGLYWLVEFFRGQRRPIILLAAVLMTVGPLFVMTGYARLSRGPEWREHAAGLVAIPYFAVLSVLAGTDVTRIFYSFCPLYAVLLASAFARSNLTGFVLAMFGYAVTNQVLVKYQQPASNGFNDDTVGFFGQFPDHGHLVVSFSIITIWFALILAARHLASVDYPPVAASKQPRDHAVGSGVDDV